MSQQEPIRVLHVARLPITVTAFLLPLLRAHKERGHTVGVACSDGPEIAKIEAEGFPVSRFTLGRNLTPWNLVRALCQLIRIVRRRRTEWVITHTPIASALARAASWLAGVPGTIYMAHGLPCAPHMSRWTWTLWYAVERLLGCCTDALITVNEYDYRLARAHRMIRRRDRIFRVNEVGVDIAYFDRLCRETDARGVKSELGVPVDAPMVLLLAWTLPTKGIREFLEAARCLSRSGVAASFVIAGQGPLDAEIAEFVGRHELQRAVFHLGWRKDAHRLLAACDIYVLPTYYPEGMPISILEAMACGKPVVATLHRGCEDEVVDGITGLLVPTRDAGALAAAVRRIIEAPDMARRFGDAGRRRVRSGFGSNDCVRAIMRAFDEINARRMSRDRPMANARPSS